MSTLQNYRERPHWSYSSLNQLLNICSLQWFFEKIEKRRRPFTPVALAFGSVYHRVMEWIALNRMEGETPTEADTRDLFHELWRRQIGEENQIRFGEKVDAKGCDRQGMDLCAAYLAQIDEEEQVLSISEAFAVPVGASEKPLVGELDCVTARLEETTVVDWKTSARRWPANQADRSLQATAYLYAYRQLHPGEGPGFRFDVAVKNKTPVVGQHRTTRDEEAFTRLEALVAQADRIVEHGLYYPADTSFYCGDCPFREPCRAWHRESTHRAARAA